MTTAAERRARFHALHRAGTFVLANPFDVGSAKLMAAAGAKALATTSAGLAMSLGGRDGTVTRDQLLAHVEVMANATDLPLNVDAEHGFGEGPDAVAATVTALAEAGAAGSSIEDWNPTSGTIEPLDVMVPRVAAAAAAADAAGMILTARCEHHLHGVHDLDATIERLRAYAEAGAHCVYAPGPTRRDDIAKLVAATPRPANVLLRPDGPAVSALADLGVRRVSVGSQLSAAAYATAVSGLEAVLDDGRLPAWLPRMSSALLRDALG